MDGYHYPRDPLPENDPPPPPLTKSMESAAFANRTALEELVYEANRAEREARAIKLQDAEDLARKRTGSCLKIERKLEGASSELEEEATRSAGPSLV